MGGCLGKVGGCLRRVPSGGKAAPQVEGASQVEGDSQQEAAPCRPGQRWPCCCSAQFSSGYGFLLGPT